MLLDEQHAGPGLVGDRRGSSGSSRSTMIGASPRLISSTISTFGSDASARAIASICCSPPESRPAGPLDAAARRAGNRSSARSVGRGLAAARPPTLAEAEVLLDGEVEEQRAVLGDVGHAAAGDACRLVADDRLRRGPRPCRPSASSSPEIVSSVVVLPAPFGPEQGDDLAGVDGEVEVADDGTPRRSPTSCRVRRSSASPLEPSYRGRRHDVAAPCSLCSSIWLLDRLVRRRRSDRAPCACGVAGALAEVGGDDVGVGRGSAPACPRR